MNTIAFTAAQHRGKGPGIGRLARHELSLAWRDLYAMLSANRPGRGMRILLILAVVLAGLHLLAWMILKKPIEAGLVVDHSLLVTISGMLLLPLSLMLSQAMESITRAFYTRSDLELILSSPTPANRLFVVRMLAIAVSTTALTLAICSPVFNILAFKAGTGWLAGYLVVAGIGLAATAFSIALALTLFAIAGPKRTRSIAQIAAAVVGAGFVVGIQLVAIDSIGSISRIGFFRSEQFAALLPNSDSLLFLPARGIAGDPAAALAVAGTGMLLFLTVVFLLSGRFGKAVVQAGSVDMTRSRTRRSGARFALTSPAATLRHKEWKVLLRDKWLISQTLMQLFYLLPPAFMLWRGFGGNSVPMFVIVPVIVMAAGQLAGGLAWLAISGEDAPELVATAPVGPDAVIRAKMEAVLGGTFIVVIPLILPIAFLDMRAGAVALFAVCAATMSSTAIQFWFRSQAKRSSFRRRHTSSRIATFAEAFSSILWSGMAALWIAGGVLLAVPFALIIGALLLLVRKLSPKGVN